MSKGNPCLVATRDIPDCCGHCNELEADEDRWGNATGEYYCLLNIMIPVRKNTCKRINELEANDDIR